MYACAGGHVQTVRVLLDADANVEDHNENGHTPLMEAASAGHVEVAKVNKPIVTEHRCSVPQSDFEAVKCFVPDVRCSIRKLRNETN